jgi:hypothetical protein
MIHLPEFSKRDLIKEYDKLKLLEGVEMEQAKIISSYTGFSIDEVYTYNLFALDTERMLKWKVADKAVSLFTY